MKPEELYASPNAIAQDYSRFRVSERLLLTGHSHQAWPDCSFAGYQQAWSDAAEFVDGKWEKVFEKVERVQRGYSELLGEPDSLVATDQNTLELVSRLVSGLPLDKRPRLIATDSEFHTLRRLLDRLAEETWIEIVKVPAEPVESLAERLSQKVDDRTAAVFCSSVLFQSGRIVPGLPFLAETCTRHGSELVIDLYHHLNAIPFDIQGLARAYLVGGGYKYCQLGEGVCFLRIPTDCNLRPILTGWFTEFDLLAHSDRLRVGYGRGAMRFAGATFDPSSYYRAASVFEYFAERGLHPAFLREVSLHQIRLLANRFDKMDWNPALIRRDWQVPLENSGGFLVLWSKSAGEISQKLKAQGVWTDSRGDALRIGPAPYLSDQQLNESMDRLQFVCKDIFAQI